MAELREADEAVESSAPESGLDQETAGQLDEMRSFDVPEDTEGLWEADGAKDMEGDGPESPRTYESNGYSYRTDEAGRIAGASGSLRLEDGERNLTAQREAGGESRLSDDDGGHIIGTRFGGSGEADNLFPQNFHVNRQEYKHYEDVWAANLEAGNEVEVDIDLCYGSRQDASRPDAIIGSYTVTTPEGKSRQDTFYMENFDLRGEEFDVSEYDEPGEAETEPYLSADERFAPTEEEQRWLDEYDREQRRVKNNVLTD